MVKLISGPSAAANSTVINKISVYLGLGQVKLISGPSAAATCLGDLKNAHPTFEKCTSDIRKIYIVFDLKFKNNFFCMLSGIYETKCAITKIK